MHWIEHLFCAEFADIASLAKYSPGAWDTSLQAGSHLGAHARAAKGEFILREESGDEARRK